MLSTRASYEWPTLWRRSPNIRPFPSDPIHLRSLISEGCGPISELRSGKLDRSFASFSLCPIFPNFPLWSVPGNIDNWQRTRVAKPRMLAQRCANLTVSSRSAGNASLKKPRRRRRGRSFVLA
jgi:hypothetical protein